MQFTPSCSRLPYKSFDKKDIFIVSACRTPIGKLCGVFKNIPATELGSIAIRDALERASIRGTDLDEVIMGHVYTGGQGANPARIAAIQAEIPNTVPAQTVNMLAASGLKSIYMAYLAIKSGEARIIVAGGQESASWAAHSMLIRPGLPSGNATVKDNILVDAFLNPSDDIHIGEAAENVIKMYTVSRVTQDDFAYKSHYKVRTARENNSFSYELTPVKEILEDSVRIVVRDEYPEEHVSFESLVTMQPAFKTRIDYTVTAGNSAAVHDGAAAMVICTGEEVIRRHLYYMARIVGCAQSGIGSEHKGLAPITAITELLRKINWKINQIDLFEIHEDFAAHTVVICETLNISEDKCNISGGAIALGNPVGCSGARILVTLVHNLRRLNKRRGIATAASGDGMAIAIAIERNVPFP